jgi:hypothetical protein
MSNEATTSDTQSVHIPRALRVRDEYKDAVGKMNPATKAYAVWTTAAKLVGPSVFASLVKLAAGKTDDESIPVRTIIEFLSEGLYAILSDDYRRNKEDKAVSAFLLKQGGFMLPVGAEEANAENTPKQTFDQISGRVKTGTKAVAIHV